MPDYDKLGFTSVNRLANLQQALDAVHSNDAAALERPPSQRRHDQETLDRLLDIAPRVRGNLDDQAADWVDSGVVRAEYELAYKDFLGRPAPVPLLASRYAHRADAVRDHTAPARRPGAVEPRYRIVLRNVLVEIAPIRAALCGAATVSTGDISSPPRVQPEQAVIDEEPREQRSVKDLVLEEMKDKPKTSSPMETARGIALKWKRDLHRVEDPKVIKNYLYKGDFVQRSKKQPT